MTPPSILLLGALLLIILPSTQAGECFADGEELKTAVRQFVNGGCSDSFNCNNSVAQQYGWPMGTWCTSQVTSMRTMFWNARSFDGSVGACSDGTRGGSVGGGVAPDVLPGASDKYSP